MKRRFLAIASGICLLTACTALPVGLAPRASMPATAQDGKATIQLQAQISAAGFRTQTQLTPYTASSVNHLTVKLFRVVDNDQSEIQVVDGSGTPVCKDIAGGSLSHPIVFNGLAMNTHYRIRAAAYLTSDTSRLISDASSKVDIFMTNDERPFLSALRVLLLDTEFDGQATASSIVISPGSLKGSGTEGIHATYFSTMTLAGKPEEAGFDNGKGDQASFNDPWGIAVDKDGYLYVADTANNAIRKVSPEGEVTTLANQGEDLSLYSPTGIAVDKDGNLYVAESGYHLIRKISPEGEVTTLAGNPSNFMGGFANGQGEAAAFRYPAGIAVDKNGYVYVADYWNHAIRKISPEGEVTTLAGSPENQGFADGQGEAAAFSFPSGIAVDEDGFVYVADTGTRNIRKISPKGYVTTLAGSLSGDGGSADGIGANARFDYPQGISVDTQGNLFVADGNTETIRRVTPTGTVTTVAGKSYECGSTDGRGARFYNPKGIVVDKDGRLFVTDNWNYTIRKLQ